MNNTIEKLANGDFRVFTTVEKNQDTIDVMRKGDRQRIIDTWKMKEAEFAMEQEKKAKKRLKSPAISKEVYDRMFRDF